MQNNLNIIFTSIRKNFIKSHVRIARQSDQSPIKNFHYNFRIFGSHHFIPLQNLCPAVSPSKIVSPPNLNRSTSVGNIHINRIFLRNREKDSKQLKSQHQNNPNYYQQQKRKEKIPFRGTSSRPTPPSVIIVVPITHIFAL